MRIGLLTNGFYRVGCTDFLWVTDWAARHGFSEIEIGDTVVLDEAMFNKVQEAGKISLQTFLYCKNMLHPVYGEMYTAELLQRIYLAKRLGMRTVVAFTGFDLTPDTNEKNLGGFRPVEEQVPLVVEKYKPIVEAAEKSGIKLAFENCPMMGNIAYSPFIFEQLFEKLDSKQVGFAFDPAHFVWLMNDPYYEILRFGTRIFHFHGKDCEIDSRRREYTGILATNDWWHYREPGLGDLDWRKVVDCLNKVGYDGVISIEHDDTVWNTTVDKVAQGFQIGRDTVKAAIRQGAIN